MTSEGVVQTTLITLSRSSYLGDRMNVGQGNHWDRMIRL